MEKENAHIRLEENLQKKLNRIFWDLPDELRTQKVEQILNNPADACKDRQISIRLLSSFGWYELLDLLGKEQLWQCLTDSSVISGLFPRQYQNYYQDAQRLLSKYSLPTPG